MVKPYNDYFSSDLSVRTRTFGWDCPDEELVWHRDKCHRQVTVLEGENWQLQFDNEKPIVMEKGRIYYIPKMMYHRVIKGDGDLVLKIWDEEKTN